MAQRQSRKDGGKAALAEVALGRPNGMDGNIRSQRLGFDSGPATCRGPLFGALAVGREVEKRSSLEGRRSGAVFRFTGVKDLIRQDEPAIGKFISSNCGRHQVP